MKIDIYFIAKKAGVSPSTVSRVFNRSEIVSKDKKERVLKVCKKYNYKPSFYAKSMRLKGTNYLGFVIPDMICIGGKAIIDYLEYVQCKNSFWWDEETVLYWLDHKMTKAFDWFYEMKEKEKVYTREVAYFVAVEKVVKAMEHRGWL